jgi:hypothetical protein
VRTFLYNTSAAFYKGCVFHSLNPVTKSTLKAPSELPNKVKANNSFIGKTLLFYNVPDDHFIFLCVGNPEVISASG